jgi:hypothetical protein
VFCIVCHRGVESAAFYAQKVEEPGTSDR